MTRFREHWHYAAALLGVAAVYFCVAKLSLALASVNPSATPVWPPTGLALAVVMLGGFRMWPAIFAAAFLVNLITNDSPVASAAIAAGNTLESITGAYLVNRWSNGVATFDTAAGVARFAAICLFPSTTVSATLGVASLLATSLASVGNAAPIWLTWWMGDLGGALIVTPAIVLTATSPPQSLSQPTIVRAAIVFTIAAVIGLVAFSPLAHEIPNRSALGFLAIAPLMWCALYQNQRDTSITIIIVACFAIWGTMAGAGPFIQSTLNESFLLLLAFMISISVPSLALSAHQVTQAKQQQRIEAVMLELSHRTKNLLSVVQSMARQIARRANSFEGFEIAFSARLLALANAHDLLVRGEWRGADLGEVIRAQLVPFIESDDPRVLLNGPPVTLAPRAVEQIGLVIHELATNAIKYGSLSVDHGEVKILWRVEADASDEGQIVLEWAEFGGPPVVQPIRTGFGHMVITDFVPRALDGRTTLDFSRAGLRWNLRMQVAFVAAKWIEPD